MPSSVLVDITTLKKVARFGVCVVIAFPSSPMERLSWVVLLVAYEADVGDSHQRVWEVVKNPGRQRMFLARLRVVLPKIMVIKLRGQRCRRFLGVHLSVELLEL